MTDELSRFLRERPETAVPGERARIARRRLVLAYALAVLAPVATALVLLPLRTDHLQLVALALVLPVLAVSALGSVGPAILAALVAGAAYDVVHTKPYWSFKVDDSEDVVTLLALMVVALTVGVLSSRMVQVRARDASRRDQLRQVLLFARFLDTSPNDDALTQEACARLSALLGLRGCHWDPGERRPAGPAGGEGPVMLRTGAVMGWAAALNPDRAKLPAEVDLPAMAGDRQVGRFVLETSGAVVSVEERLTAATIASLFAHFAARR